MSPMLENLIVGVIVGITAVWAVRAIWRSRKKESGCANCTDSVSCGAADKSCNTQPLQDLQTLDSRRR